MKFDYLAFETVTEIVKKKWKNVSVGDPVFRGGLDGGPLRDLTLCLWLAKVSPENLVWGAVYNVRELMVGWERVDDTNWVLLRSCFGNRPLAKEWAELVKEQTLVPNLTKNELIAEANKIWRDEDGSA